jgi:hypothetical protein
VLELMSGLREEVVGGDCLDLAACAEASVSFLLAHLDLAGINKTTLEVIVDFISVPQKQRRGFREQSVLYMHLVQLFAARG